MAIPSMSTPTLIRLFSFIIFNFAVTSIAFAQSHPCGTDLLENNKNISELPTLNTNNVTTRKSYSLPVALHVIRTDHSFQSHFYVCEPTTDSKLVQDELVAANEFFKPHDIAFFLCGEINFIRSTDLNVIDLHDDERSQLDAYNIKNAINVYYVHSIQYEGEPFAGYAYFPYWTSNRHIVMSRSNIYINGITLAHELGHALGLYHPHETYFGNELVDGSNCHEAGDLICDTPADPNLYNKVNTNCKYTRYEVDSLETFYTPNTELIMSYSRPSCKTLFTPQQADKMKEVCEQYYKDYACSNARPEIEFNVYPNPASELLHIGTIDNVEMEIFDASGRFYRPVQVAKRCLNISSLNDGIYFIRVKIVDTDESETFKFMVSN